MVDYSLIELIPAEESHYEFYYTVKKEAYGGYITRTWGWDEQKERNFQAQDWTKKRPSIILYDTKPIGAIYTSQDKDSIEIAQFYILPEYQNQGIGSYILEGILNNADRTGLTVKLMYLCINPAASLYARMGFKVIGAKEPFIMAERKPRITAQNDRKYKAVIFDLFGTLVKIFSRAEYESVLDNMIDILQAPRDEFIRLWYDTGKMRTTGEYATLEENLEYIMRELKTVFSREQVERACKIRMYFVARAMTPKPDAIATLKLLKTSGYKIGLLSNCSTEPPVIWPGTPFAPYFDAAIFSSTCGLQKPDPRIFRLAAEKLGIKPEDCVFVGDGDSNELSGSSDVGMRAVLIHDPDEKTEEVIRSGYQGDSWDGDFITSLREITNLIGK